MVEHPRALPRQHAQLSILILTAASAPRAQCVFRAQTTPELFSYGTPTAAMRARSHSSGHEDVEENASDAQEPFELTANLLKAKRLTDMLWAREAFASAGWLLSPGPGALAALILILANEIVFHTSPTTCVRPLGGERPAVGDWWMRAALGRSHSPPGIVCSQNMHVFKLSFLPFLCSCCAGVRAVFVQGIIALSWMLVLIFANQLVGQMALRSFFILQAVYSIWLVVALVWLVLGVVFAAGSEPCLETAPYLYRLAIAQVVLLVPLIIISIGLEIEWCVRKRPFFTSEARRLRRELKGEGGNDGPGEEGDASDSDGEEDAKENEDGDEGEDGDETEEDVSDDDKT